MGQQGHSDKPAHLAEIVSTVCFYRFNKLGRVFIHFTCHRVAAGAEVVRPCCTPGHPFLLLCGRGTTGMWNHGLPQRLGCIRKHQYVGQVTCVK